MQPTTSQWQFWACENPRLAKHSCQHSQVLTNLLIIIKQQLLSREYILFYRFKHFAIVINCTEFHICACVVPLLRTGWPGMQSRPMCDIHVITIRQLAIMIADIESHYHAHPYVFKTIFMQNYWCIYVCMCVFMYLYECMCVI